MASVAVRYAKDVLDRRSEVAMRLRLMFPFLLCVCVVAMADGYDRASSSPRVTMPFLVFNLVAAVLFIIGALFAVRAGIRLRRYYWLRRVERVTWTAPASRASRAAPASEGEGEELALHTVPRKALRATATLMAILCVGVAWSVWETASQHGMDQVTGVVAMIMLACALLLAAGQQAWMALRWARPGRPVIELDSEGAHLHLLRLTVPWPEVSEIRLLPVRGGLGMPNATAAGLVCADPGAVLGAARLSWLRRSQLASATRVYGTPLVISDMTIDHTAEEIARAASRLAGVPVRRR